MFICRYFSRRPRPCKVPSNIGALIDIQMAIHQRGWSTSASAPTCSLAVLDAYTNPPSGWTFEPRLPRPCHSTWDSHSSIGLCRNHVQLFKIFVFVFFCFRQRRVASWPETVEPFWSCYWRFFWLRLLMFILEEEQKKNNSRSIRPKKLVRLWWLVAIVTLNEHTEEFDFKSLFLSFG